MAKQKIIETLGEAQLLLPELVRRGLAANDAVKYRLSLLQAARAAADGAAGTGDLREERLSSGVVDDRLDLTVAGSVREPDGRYRIPGSRALIAQAIADVGTMLVPLQTTAAPTAASLTSRLEAVSARLDGDGDLLSAENIVRLTAGDGRTGDTLHRIVMNAHRELNALAAGLATETLDGAHAFGLSEPDRPLVRAFMRGVHRTAALKFDHPGLDTLATRAGTELVLQNDLGETDAHVIVIRVAGPIVTITYTDVHLTRLLFFQELLAPAGLAWDDTRSRSDRSIEGGLFHLVVGRLEASDDVALESFLELLGSRLVFMIDWNRARKRLRRLVGRRAALALLTWAAEHDYGHMAFLLVGGDGLVYEALEFAGGRPARAGESLADVLGDGPAESYMRAVLRIAAEGLLAGRPAALVQDEVRTELTGYVRSARQEIHELALRHAELCVEVAEGASDALERAIAGDEKRRLADAARARQGEHEADGLLIKARAAVAHNSDLSPQLGLLEAADDIADCAEEAAFYATLLPTGVPAGEVRDGVRRIAWLVLTAAREYLRAVQMSVELRRGSPREDMDAFLAATHRTLELEHGTDESQRAIHRALVAEGDGPRAELFVVVELTRSFEEAADALMHAGYLLREHTLARVVRSEASSRHPTESAAASVRGRGTEPPGEHVYLIGEGSTPLPPPRLLGAKAHGLARIARAGLRVPEAAVLTTELWRAQLDGGGDQRGLREALAGATRALSDQCGLVFGGIRRPLLVSVRSGAPVSMPGMLETVLNVGLCDATVRGVIAQTGNPRLAWDCYRRLVEGYATVVRGCEHEPFQRQLRESLAAARAERPRELSARALEELTRQHLARYAQLTGEAFPQDPAEQLLEATRAVLASWDGAKARAYRASHRIPDDLGTAVILQRMVFGNAGGVSGAGVGFTRDPVLGERRLYVDFLLDAQGEDVVSGRHTLEGVSELVHLSPDLLSGIEAACPRLEAEFGDAQEFELTIDQGELFFLQARTAKRTPWAAVQIASDLVHEGLIGRDEAVARVSELDLGAIRRVRVDRTADGMLAHAIPASIGVATGPIALDPIAVERYAAAGNPPVLVRADTITEDVAALGESAGLLTASGGRTSHAAVVARELGKPCLVGCERLLLDLDARIVTIGDRQLGEGDVISIDAEAGSVYAGAPPLIEERPTQVVAELEAWRAESLASPRP